jgi:hypothetical protein
MPTKRPEEQYLIEAITQGDKGAIAINAKEKYSVISTGLLESLDTRGCHIKFQREFIVLSNSIYESLGKIRNLEITLKHVSIKPTLYIIRDEHPYLMFGQDWFRQYQAQYNSIRTKLRFCYKDQNIYLPLFEIDENDEASLPSDKEEELIDLNTIKCNQTNAKKGLLINLFEDNMISQQKDKPLVSLNLHELDVKEFQQAFDQKSQKDKNIMSYDLVDKIINMYNNDLSSPEISDEISKEPEESTDSTQLLQPTTPDYIIYNSDQNYCKNSCNSKNTNQVNVKKKKCFLCDRSSHVMQECSLLPEFRKHEIYCKKKNIHVWKSWKRKVIQFKEGDLVLYCKNFMDNRQVEKLGSKWKGPFIIHHIIGNGNYKLRNLEGKILKTSINKSCLKIYNGHKMQGQF